MYNSMNEQEFLSLTKNWNWSKTSLNIVFDLFVKNETSKNIAIKYNKYPSYINVYKKRFIEKKQKEELKTFTENNKPKNIKAYKNIIYTLWDKTYSPEQIIKYLKENEHFTTSKEDIINLILHKGKK